MKIALCFSGQARSVEAGYEYYKRNLFDHWDVDVFFHTWYEGDDVQKMTHTYSDHLKGYGSDPRPQLDVDSKYTNTPNPQKHPPRFTYAMYYSMNRCRELLNYHSNINNVKYDWVIRSRPDYALNVTIPFDKMSNDCIYIPDCRMVPERDFGNDQFAFSSQDNMDKYKIGRAHV